MRYTYTVKHSWVSTIFYIMRLYKITLTLLYHLGGCGRASEPEREIQGSNPTTTAGFEPHDRRVVSLSKTLKLSKVLVPRKQWHRPNMPEKLFTGTLTITKQNYYITARINGRTPIEILRYFQLWVRTSRGSCHQKKKKKKKK